MVLLQFEQGVVERIGTRLDQLDFRASADELVVVGGAALAAYGIESLQETDIDLVVGRDLMRRLQEDGRWKRIDQCAPDGGLETVGDGYRSLTAMRMPFPDRIYPATSYDLISEGIVPDDSKSPYRFSPVARILDWKLALASSFDYQGPREKHIRDARRISAFLLDGIQTVRA